MKKWLALFLALVCALSLTGCGGDSVAEPKPEPVAPAETGMEEPAELPEKAEPETEPIAKPEEEPEEEHWDLIPMVRVDGKLYYATGRESIALRCGVMDGEITSSVEGWETPAEDDQSNFGSGYGYQYGSDDTIEVCMEDGRWYIYEYGSGEGKIRFGDTWYDRGFLSDETVEWIEWFNSLTPEEQAAVDSIPGEL